MGLFALTFSLLRDIVILCLSVFSLMKKVSLCNNQCHTLLGWLSVQVCQKLRYCDFLRNLNCVMYVELYMVVPSALPICTSFCVCV